jgi:predicted AlkP superfamily phosphohydrolase/phosphomutase
VNLNTWLHERGLLVLRDGVAPGEQAGELLRQVDWSQTRAYALGLSGIYLNLQGREAHGIVPPDQAETLKTMIARELSGLEDPVGGVAVRGVQAREQVYSGPYAAESPDLVVQFGAGYRISWSSSMGGVAAELFENNTKKWGGDHIIDPELVPGVLLMNRPFRSPGARLVDLAPTILAALGVPQGPAMEGSSLLP